VLSNLGNKLLESKRLLRGEDNGSGVMEDSSRGGGSVKFGKDIPAFGGCDTFLNEVTVGVAA
jgi:hypothetical protein